MWWSLEKNGRSIVLQQSKEKDDVVEKLYDAVKGQSDERYGEVKFKKSAMGNFNTLTDLLQIVWETNQIIDPYHLLYSNCQHFASFIFEKLNGEREEWSTDLSAIFGRLSGRKKKTAIELNTVMYKSILQDDKFDYCKAMIDGRRKDFEELTNDLTIETLNSVDSQGYTLLQWATVYSTTDWPIAELLKDKGAQIPSNEALFRRDVFFIALQYLPPNKKSKLFDSFDGIDMNGENGTGDTALHLALYGEKWGIAEKILNQYENYDVDSTNSLGETALHLAAKLNCKIGLFTKILFLTNSVNINKADGIGNTALHYAIDEESGTKVKELLNHKGVDVTIQNNEDYCTALHLASKWPTIPADLFEIILKKSTDFKAQDVNGNTALHYAIMTKSETAVEELLKHKYVNVNVANNQNAIALHLACICENFPMHLFKQILEKSTDVINAQDEDGNTALHIAIRKKSETFVKELLNHKDVAVNIKNIAYETAIDLACKWKKEMPMDFHLFKTIVNAQDKDGNTALHFALHSKSETKVMKLLVHKDVDVNIKGKFNYTPLHLASNWTDISMNLFRIILKKSTNVNAQDKNGWTALHYAIQNSENATKELLAHKDVDVNVKNNSNETALHLASQWKVIYDTFDFFDFKIFLFDKILRRSTDVNAQNKDGNTPLHIAIFKNSQEAITALLEDDRVDVKVKNHENRTALYYSLEWKWAKISANTDVRELLKLDDVDAKNKKGRTALHLVSKLQFFPDNLIKIIVKQSTDVNAQDKKGDTALHIAIRNRNDVAEKELRKREDLDVNIKNNKNETASDQ